MLKIIKRFTKKEWLMVFASAVFILLQVGLELAIPGYMTKITTALETAGSTTSDILIPGVQMLIYSLLSVASSIVVGYFAANLAASFSAELRNDVFNQVLDYSETDIGNFSTSSLLTRTTNDITQVQTLIAMGTQALIKAPITAIWAITKIADKNWEWTATTGLALLILVVMLATILILVQPRFKRVQSLTDKLNLVTGENLSGIKVVHAFNAEEYQNQKFDTANQEITSTNLFANRVLALMNPGMSLISNGLTLAVYAVGAGLILAATGSAKLSLFSDMIVFSSYAMQVIMAFLMLSIIFVIMPRVSVSITRLNEVLDITPSITYSNAPVANDTKKGSIEFQNVSFKFNGAEDNSIQNINFTSKPGSTTAIVGSTGSGKSTVLNLMTRRFDATKGKILIDGVDIREYPEDQLNDKFGYIPQKAVLFSGTIRSNLDFGTSTNKTGSISDNDLRSALSVAQATDFTQNLDDPVAQNGDNFSGGQKQRLAIARAIARKPEILIFDDSFSALDYENDAKLRKALSKKTPTTTKIIVAQRISTILSADQIIVLNEGKVVGMGTHQELLNSNKTYQEIAYSQLSKKELTNNETK